jgi:hypothetical protein
MKFENPFRTDPGKMKITRVFPDGSRERDIGVYCINSPIPDQAMMLLNADGIRLIVVCTGLCLIRAIEITGLPSLCQQQISFTGDYATQIIENWNHMIKYDEAVSDYATAVKYFGEDFADRMFEISTGA